MSNVVYTIGHSTHTIEQFVSLLKHHDVTAIADVRSNPYSGFNPHFNREALRTALDRARIEYVFLGDALGARSRDRACYVNGKVSYELLGHTPLFQRGLHRIAHGSAKHRIAIMCAEKDPLTCHRAILVSRPLGARGIVVQHILEDGSLESHDQAVRRMLAELSLPDRDLFRTRDEIVDEAYRRRGDEIAHAGDAREYETEEAGAKE